VIIFVMISLSDKLSNLSKVHDSNYSPGRQVQNSLSESYSAHDFNNINIYETYVLPVR